VCWCGGSAHIDIKHQPTNKQEDNYNRLFQSQLQIRSYISMLCTRVDLCGVTQTHTHTACVRCACILTCSCAYPSTLARHCLIACRWWPVVAVAFDVHPWRAVVQSPSRPFDCTARPCECRAWRCVCRVAPLLAGLFFHDAVSRAAQRFRSRHQRAQCRDQSPTPSLQSNSPINHSALSRSERTHCLRDSCMSIMITAISGLLLPVFRSSACSCVFTF
jgi:hypothetical protein